MTGRGAGVVAALLLMGACGGGLTLPATREPVPAGPPSAPPPAAGALETQIHELVNRRRTGRGLPPLAWDARVAEIAREHSRAMAGGRRPFSHDGFDERAAAIGASLRVASIAENVAYDSRSGAALAQHVVEGWVASAGHRQNIEGDFSVTGIGAAQAPDGVRYFTQIFVKTR